MILHLDICPCCGSELIEHSLATSDTYEAWRFDCGAEILRWDNGKLIDEQPCEGALQKVLNRLNVVFAGTDPVAEPSSQFPGPGERLNAILLEVVRMCEVDGIGRTTLQLDDVMLNGRNVGSWKLDLRKFDPRNPSTNDEVLASLKHAYPV